jgi:hypothetical protein
MARTAARLTEDSRITDYISLGVVAKTFPRPLIEDILRRTGRTSARERDLPAHVVIYYVIALALYMQTSYREVLRCLMEGAQWLADAEVDFNGAAKSSISQARTRLGWEAVRLLHDEVVRPIATEATPGAFFRQWHLVSIDGSSLDLPDELANQQAFGSRKPPAVKPPFHRSASFPWWRMERTCSLAVAWRPTGSVRARWLRKSFPC